MELLVGLLTFSDTCMSNPRISIVIPIHASMKHGEFFLWRLTQSIMMQSFKDYEIVIVQEGSMPVNTNAGIRKAKGELIKILYMDDYFAHKDALKHIVEAFNEKDVWLATGCLHQHSSPETLEEPHSPHLPSYAEDMHRGNNTIGSPSVITIRNTGHLLFDEKLSFFLDCDLYKRYHDKYGLPILLPDLNVVIGIGDHQTSSYMPVKEKQAEFTYMQKKYA